MEYYIKVRQGLHMHAVHMVGCHSSNTSIKPSLRFQAEQSDIIKLKEADGLLTTVLVLCLLLRLRRTSIGVMGHGMVSF
jgi:hypothetical protein